MAYNKTPEELQLEIDKWNKTKTGLNREIAAIEQSTTNIVSWANDKSSNIINSYALINEAIYQKDEAGLDKVVNDSEALEVMGVLLQMPLVDGQSIVEAVKEAFGENSAIFQKVNRPYQEFPANLTVDKKDIDEEDLDKTTKAEEIKEPEEHWWSLKSTIERNKQEYLQEKLKVAKEEVVGLQTNKPFYIDSFFQWLDAVQNSRADVPGDGEYIDFLRETYRNPEYLITQVYNDSNETVHAVFEEIYTKASATYGVKAGFSHKNSDEIGQALYKHQDNEDLLSDILEAEGYASFGEWSIKAFSDPHERTEVYNRIIDIIPLELVPDIEIAASIEEHSSVDRLCESSFNKIFEMVLSKELEPSCIATTINAISKVANHEIIIDDIRNNLSKYIDPVMLEIDKNPEWATSMLHSIFGAIDNDTTAVDFYVNMHNALSEKNKNYVEILLKNTEQNILEQWLLLRDIIEPQAEGIMQEIMDIDKGNSALFKAAVDAGIPPVFIRKGKNKVSDMQAEIGSALFESIRLDTDAAYEIFESTLNFVAANTTKKQFTEILSIRDPYYEKSLVEKVLSADKNKQGKYFNTFFKSIEDNVEIADILYVASKGSIVADNKKTLMQMADKKIGKFIEINTDDMATVLYTDKLSHVNEEAKYINYFSGLKAEQSETNISEKNAQTYIDVIGERDNVVKINNNLVSPKDWDVIFYNENAEEIEFIKNNQERIVLPLPLDDSANILSEIFRNHGSNINIQDRIIIKPNKFETLRYDDDINELVVNQAIVLHDVSLKEFNTILTDIQKTNKDTIRLEQDNLVLNLKVIDGTNKNSFTRKESTENEGIDEQFIGEILMNGRSIGIKSLFRGRSYDFDTDFDKQDLLDDNVVFYVMDLLEQKSNFEKISDTTNINTNNVTLARAEKDNNLVIATNNNKYYLDIVDKDINWVSVDHLLETPFILEENGQFEFRIFDEDVYIDKSAVNKNKLDKKYTRISDDFLCNLNDICEVSLYKEDKRIVLKSPQDNVTINLNDNGLKNIFTTLSLNSTVLKQATAKKAVNKNKTSKQLDFFKKPASSISDNLSRIKKYKR